VGYLPQRIDSLDFGIYGLRAAWELWDFEGQSKGNPGACKSMKGKGLVASCNTKSIVELEPTMSGSNRQNCATFGTLIAPYNQPGIFVPFPEADSGGL
jgi:hypothetical protein